MHVCSCACVMCYYHGYTDINRPLREDEVLPVRTHCVVQHQSADDVTDVSYSTTYHYCALACIE